jgi:Uncharacterised protein family (UPF0175)
MEVTLRIPDDIAQQLQAGNGDVSRRLLGMAALEGYKSGELTAYQVQQMPGFETRMEVDEFLKRHEVYDYTAEDLTRDRETLHKLFPPMIVVADTTPV